MSVREVLLALVLVGASALIVWGVSMWSVPWAAIVAGALTGFVGIVFLYEVDG